MSYQTVLYEVRIDRDQLLKLFLGHGDLLITLEGHTTTVEEISDRHVICELNGVELHSVKIHGVSDDPEVTCVDGIGILKPVVGSQAFTLSLELHLQDRFE